MLYLAGLIGVYLVFFLIGAVPFGPIVARLKKVDLRTVGSGNIGATNVYRALGLKYAVWVFLLDGAKGALPPLLVQYFFGHGPLVGIAAVMAVLGHIFSPFLKFKGGKGVATGFGAMLALAPVPALISLAIWITITAATKIVGLASVIAAISLPVLMIAFPQPLWVFYATLIIVILVLVSHHENLQRLWQGKEKPIARSGP